MYSVCIVHIFILIKSKNIYNPYKNEKYHDNHNFNVLLESHSYIKLEKQIFHILENFKLLFDKFRKYNNIRDSKSNKKRILYIEKNINSFYRKSVEMNKKFEKNIFHLIETLKSKGTKILSKENNRLKCKSFNLMNYTKNRFLREIELKHKLFSNQEIKNIEIQIYHIYESYEKLSLYLTKELSNNNVDAVSFSWAILSRIIKCQEIIEYIAINDLHIHKKDLY
ncbi:hypothetical protein CWI37_2147p0010 [Hamiltosporidium tvaerminnensis]|uniref:Uncharacterized protein n=1 Tax=Hamiltosporidium tvaerminnensis TaxID=1176355 RepID=A0A4Q9KSA2_9MICR|nr:hypothetical protein CWI37_2147p0010 [Hamiltosporidium tvaerminnensis]